jgi:nucleoside-diphosphate-sugar epimerase
MNVLLTGHRGRLGRAIEARLAADGHAVRGYDLADGDDILDAAAVARAAEGVDVIVHAGGLADDRGGTPADVMAANLLGTWNVLLAAEAAGARRVVYLSSGKSLGMLERDPDYLPVDDDHRGLPGRPYGLAKWLSEEMCAAFTARTGIDTICLRPVAVFDDAGYKRAIEGASKPRAPGAIWHLGVHIDLRDVVEATVAALRCPPPSHVRLLLCAADIADRRPTLGLVAEHLPTVPWRGGPEYQRDPYRGLVDISRASKVLGWQPRHLWPGRAAQGRVAG